MPFDGTPTPPLLWNVPTNFSSHVRRTIAMLMPSRSFEHAVRRLLHKARTRIERPENWCQGHYTTGSGAVCLLSALHHAGEHGDRNVLNRARYELLSTVRGIEFSTVELMNDGLRHHQLLAAIDEALLNLCTTPRPGRG